MARSRGAESLRRAIAPLLNTPDSPHFANRLAYAGMRLQLGENHNMRLDRMTMSMSVEARSPLQDYRLAELALNLPLEYKLRRGGFKMVFKDAVANRIPEEVLRRPKWGFTPPASEWLRTSLLDLMKKTLTPDRVAAAGVFQPAALQQAVHDHVIERIYELWPLWSALIFHLWHAHFIESESPAASMLTPQMLAESARII